MNLILHRSIPVFLLAAAMLSASAHAGLRVFACEPEWGALVKEIGGARVDVYTATTAMQDPHRIEARPSLIARARNADLLVCTGAGLEAGWLPLVIARSGNARIQNGRPGQFLAANHVTMRDRPAVLDRAAGDVHAEGNPHVHTDPRNIARIGAALTLRLAEIDPAGAAGYRARWQDFSTRWQTAIARWQQRAAPLRGVPVAVQHRSFSYLLDWLGLREVATLEPKPGIEPSLGHLAEVAARLETTPVRMVLRARYQSPRAAQWLAARANLAEVVLPFTVGGAPGADDLFGLFEVTLDELLKAAR